VLQKEKKKKERKTETEALRADVFKVTEQSWDHVTNIKCDLEMLTGNDI
jgi:hypothetical protein